MQRQQPENQTNAPGPSEKNYQRTFAELLQLNGLDVDKNAIQRIESGQRFVTDIELKTITIVLKTKSDELLK